MKLRRIIIQIPIILQLLMGLTTCVEFQPKSKIFKFLSGIAQTSKDVLNGTVHRAWGYLPPLDTLYPDDTVVCDLFEYFKVKMRSSHPHLDLPVLDPFTTDYLEGNIVNDIIGNVSIHLQEVNLTGLSQYEIKKVKMNWLPRRLNLNVNIPHILARGVYSIGGILGDVIPLHGNGPVQLSVTNLNIKGEIFLGTLNGYIYIKSLSLNYTIQEMKVDLTNFMGGGRLGELLNKALSEGGPRILDLVREDLTYFCENWLNKHANNVLTKISITLTGVIDFLKIIGTKKVNSIFSLNSFKIEL